MDTNDYPSLPNLAQIHARLSANSRRVEEIVDSQISGIDRLLDATIAEDWEAVSDATRYLAKQRPDKFSAEVIEQARRVFEELNKVPHKTKKPKHLANLLAACRAQRKKL